MNNPHAAFPLAIAMLCSASFCTGCADEITASASEASSESPPKQISTIHGIQAQLEQQLLDQWEEHGLKSVTLQNFQTPNEVNELTLGIQFHWSDTDSTTTTGMRLQQVAGRYYVGTVTLDQVPIPANVMLAFD